MPCFSVTQCESNLNNADHGLLKKALEDLGYTVTMDSSGKIKSFSRGAVTGTYSNDKLQLTARGGKNPDANEIKRAYSHQVIMKQRKEAHRNGWDMVREGQEYVFRPANLNS